MILRKLFKFPCCCLGLKNVQVEPPWKGLFAESERKNAPMSKNRLDRPLWIVGHSAGHPLFMEGATAPVASYHKGLSLREVTAGAPARSITQTLRHLGARPVDRKQSKGAEALLRRAVALDTQDLGPDYPFVVRSLLNVKMAYLDQVNAVEAWPGRCAPRRPDRTGSGALATLSQKAGCGLGGASRFARRDLRRGASDARVSR
jgi:hypothetical protein